MLVEDDGVAVCERTFIHFPDGLTRASMMPLAHLVQVLLVFVALLIVGCDNSEQRCAEPSPFQRGAAGMFCTAGPTDCEPGLACRGWTGDNETSSGAVCGACTDAVECPTLDGCGDDGVCGACVSDGQCRDDEACRLGFCLPESVPVWNLELDETDWQKLQTDWYSDYYFDCSLQAGGEKFDDGCEVRPYGSTSRRYPKKSLRIRFPDGADHPGFTRKITLRAEYNDSTYMRTFIAYETFRRLTSLPTPNVRFIELQINGETYGLMLELERNGPKFLEENGRDRDLPMFEAERAPPWGGMMPMACSDEYEFFDAKELYNQKSGEDGDIEALQQLIEDVLWQDYLDSQGDIGSVLDRTRQVVDLDSHVSYLAIHGLIQNRDHVAANYHVAQQSEQQWANHFIPDGGTQSQDASTDRMWWEVYPYDLDTSFGCVYDSVNVDNICDDLQSDVWWLGGLFPDDEPVGYPHEQWGNLLSHLVLDNADCRNVFNHRLRDFSQDPWWTERLPELVVGLRETLKDPVQRDNNDLNVETDLSDWEESIYELLQFIPARASYIQECVDAECG